MDTSKSGAFGAKYALRAKMYWLFVRHTYLLLLIPLFFIAYPLMGPGISIGGDFPLLDTSHYGFDRLWMWAEKGSFPSFESIPRFPTIGFFYLLSLINVGSDVITKIMIVMGFFIASFSFYYCFLFLLKDKLISITRKNSSLLLLNLSAISGSIFYAYNVWSFHRIAHWYLWLGYTLLPLFLICIISSYKNSNRWKYVLFSVLLWTLASSTPHMAVFYAIIFIGTFFALILNDYYNNKNNNNNNNNNTKSKTAIIKKTSIPFLLIFLFYF